MAPHKTPGGSVLFEFTLVLPIILLIGYGAIDIVRALRHHQMVAALTREVGNEVFRTCPLPVAPAPVPDQCMSQIVGRSLQNIAPILQFAQVYVRFFESQSSLPVEVASNIGVGIAPSFSPRLSASSPELTQLFNSTPKNMATVVEVTALYRPLLSSVISFVPYLANKELHDVVIF